MGSTAFKGAAAGGLAAFIVLAAVMPGWGTELTAIRLLDLPDRDVVVLDGSGDALESTLKAFKPKPSRLELMFKSGGSLPAVPAAAGDLVTGIQLKPRDDGFLLTLNLGSGVPVDGADSFYRETALPGGKTVVEIFNASSSHSPFKAEWLTADDGAVNVLGTLQNAPVPATHPVLPTPGFVPDTKPMAPLATGTAAATAGFGGASFDPASLSLILRGVGQADSRIIEQSFPPRVDIQLPQAVGHAGLTGLVHKDLRGQVTNIEVLDARGGSGLVVRATLAPGMGLLGSQERDGNLVLSFGQKETPVAAATAKPTPAAPVVPQPAPRTFGQDAPPPASPHAISALSASVPDSADAADVATSAAPPAPEPARAMPVPQVQPEPAASGWTPAAPSGTLGGQLSASAGGGGLDLSGATTPTGFAGQKQQAPSVDQIMAMAQADAKKYVSGAANKNDVYGKYALPAFEGEKEQLSDVRVNLNAAGGFSLYQFIMFLSQISGISIIIDPYWVDDPTGNPTGREPADPGFIPGDSGGQGFRGAGVFDPQFGAPGNVRGNFDNVPFDQALDIVLKTNNLEKVVYKDKNDPYSKPVILITSKARIEYELQGTNEIDLYQLHYADPNQLVQILDQLHLLPLVNVGWYVYQGTNRNNGGGQGGNNQGGQGTGGSGGTGGGTGGGLGRSFDPSLTPIAASVQGQIFDPLQTGGGPQPYQAGGGGIGSGGGGGGQTGGGGTGGQTGGGQGGQGGNNGLPVSTAKSGLVIMKGTRETLDSVQSLIAKIDKPPKQVQLTVKIYTVSDSPENVWGLLNATATSGRFSYNYSLGDLSVGLLNKGTDLPDQYSAQFDFLTTQNKAKIVAEQGVTVIDGFPATFNDSRTRGQLQSTLTFDANGNAIRTAQFNPVTVGSLLTFTPQIDDRGRVTLGVNISLSTFDGLEQIAPDGQATFQPTRQTTLSTVLRMVDGQTALIAGVTGSTDSKIFQGIPYLSRLPIIGRLLGRNVKDKTNNQLFILINVRIVDDK